MPQAELQQPVNKHQVEPHSVTQTEPHDNAKSFVHKY
jgi:hypothetical protein